MKVFKITEWQSPTGRWNAVCTDNLAAGSACWWVPARILGISLTDYIRLLINEYHAIIDGWHDYGDKDKRNSFLSFHFDTYAEAHKYALTINLAARHKQYMI